MPYSAKVLDISEWNIIQWIAPTGTRNKFMIEDPNSNKLYYFKESKETYPSEFWSEIIASKVGKYLGFNLLDYNIGIYRDKVGCICESMINIETEELIHGISLLKKYNKDFVVTDRPKISFQEVEKSFRNYRDFINHFIDIMIFDSIIGNQDRHSENWAIIRTLDSGSMDYNKSRFINYLKRFYKDHWNELKISPFRKFYEKNADELAIFDYKFSPIYDSGSSLGREISEESIFEYINNKEEIFKYIKKGISEIKWGESKEKVNHFELLLRIDTSNQNKIKPKIFTFVKEYETEIIFRIISSIDDELNDRHKEFKLSLQRKELIYLFIVQRIEYLKTIFKIESNKNIP